MGRLQKSRRLRGAGRDELIPCRSSIGTPAPCRPLPLRPGQPRRGEGRLAESSLSKGKGDALRGEDLWGRASGVAWEWVFAPAEGVRGGWGVGSTVPA